MLHSVGSFEEKRTAVYVTCGITKRSNGNTEFSDGDDDADSVDAHESEVEMTKKIRRPLSMDKAADSREAFDTMRMRKIRI